MGAFCDTLPFCTKEPHGSAALHFLVPVSCLILGNFLRDIQSRSDIFRRWKILPYRDLFQ